MHIYDKNSSNVLGIPAKDVPQTEQVNKAITNNQKTQSLNRKGWQEQTEGGVKDLGAAQERRDKFSNSLPAKRDDWQKEAKENWGGNKRDGVVKSLKGLNRIMQIRTRLERKDQIRDLI